MTAVYTFWDRLSFIEMPSHNRSVKSLSSSTHCGPIIPPMEVLWEGITLENQSWPCILVTAVRPARYNRLGILQLLWRSKKPFTMREAFSKLTLENTSRLAVLLSLALGRVFSQSANFCSLDLLSMSIAWEAYTFPHSSNLSMPTIRAVIFIGRWTWSWDTTWLINTGYIRWAPLVQPLQKMTWDRAIVEQRCQYILQ